MYLVLSVQFDGHTQNATHYPLMSVSMSNRCWWIRNILEETEASGHAPILAKKFEKGAFISRDIISRKVQLYYQNIFLSTARVCVCVHVCGEHLQQLFPRVHVLCTQQSPKFSFPNFFKASYHTVFPTSSSNTKMELILYYLILSCFFYRPVWEWLGKFLSAIVLSTPHRTWLKTSSGI